MKHHPNGSKGVLDSHGSLVAIKKAVCSDGQARRVTLTGIPDTLYSIPGYVQVSREGRLYTVIGKAYFEEGDGYYFAADREGKNYFALNNEKTVKTT